jgi:ribose transport system substrate-binding protein
MSRFRAYVPVALILPALALVLASCSHDDQGEETSGGIAPRARKPAARAPSGQKLKIWIVTNGVSPFWDSMRIGMERTAKELGCDASWWAPQNALVAEQRRLIEDAIAQHVDGLAVSAIDAEALTPSINQAVDQDIKTITFDSDAAKSKRLIYIGTNNKEAGKQAGEMAKKVFPNGGKLIGFVGNLSAENARDRVDGFKEGVQGTQIELVDVVEDIKDPIRAQRNVEDQIQKRSDINGFIGFYSYNLPAIVHAVSAANASSKYKIIGFDAEPKTLEALANKQIEFTVVQKPYEFGRQSVMFLYKAKTEGVDKAKQEMKVPPDGNLDTGVEIVTPQTYPEFKKHLDELGVKSS